MATKVEREILVLNRYEIKQDCLEKGLHAGDVVLHIRNDKGVEYYTTLRRNKCHSCNCVATKPCYHIKQMVVKENARYAAKVAKPVVESSNQEVTPLKQWIAKEISTVELVEKTTDLSTKGNLNGSRAFSLMR